MSNNGPPPRLIVSHLTLRRAVGAMGVLLPIALAVGYLLVGGSGILASISDYYHTDVGDVFVGTMFAIGWFLFAYRGHERQDDLAGDFAWVCALGVALFPTGHPVAMIRALHFIAAALLFLTLAYFSWALFTKTGGSPTPEKLKRNKIYRACAVVMVACIVLIAVYSWFLSGTPLSSLKPVFWLETFALWAFGTSWFIKGETLLKDPEG
jgi:hypothetical protein